MSHATATAARPNGTTAAAFSSSSLRSSSCSTAPPRSRSRTCCLWVAQHVVIPKVFWISHVLNTGAAFSLFGDTASPERVRWLLVGFSLIAAVIIGIVLMRIGRRITATTFGLALILGGAIGNVWDRMRTGAVIDFLEVHIVHYHWPDFNVADSCIVIGGILLVLHSLVAAREP